MRLQPETLEELAKINPKTVAAKSAALGVEQGEPLLYAMDALLRYAKAYRQRFETPLGEDGFLAEPFLEAIKGIRTLLNGDGAVAMERGITTDSKDNGMIENLYWRCCDVAGIDGND